MIHSKISKVGVSMQVNTISLLKSKRFLPLFITQFLGAFNDNIFKNALVILITYKMISLWGLDSQTLVVLAAGIFILPFFLFSVSAGQLADKYAKNKLIIFIKLIEIILMCLAAYGFLTEKIEILFLVLFALGIHSTFFGPLKYAILPEHLHEDELIAGNGLIEAGTFLSILLGTILGSMLILLSYGEVIIIVMILSAAVGGSIVSYYIPKSHACNTQIKMSLNIFKETKALIQYSKKQKDIFLSILGISWFWFFGSVFLLEFPTFTKEFLHANEKIVTLFLTLFSIGLATGSVLCNRLLKGKIHANYVPVAILAMSLFTIDLYFAANHFQIAEQNQLIGLIQFLTQGSGWRICIDLLLIAISGGIYTVPLYAILQQRSEKAHRARVIASNNVINALFMVSASIFIMIFLKIGFSVNQLFLSIGIANTIVAFYICKLLPDILIKNAFKFILTSFYRVKVKGLENYKNAGERIIIIANHTSFLDALLLGTFLPDKLIFAVNTVTSQKWWIKLFLRLVDAYPIDSSNPMSLKSLIELVEQGKKCVIFPEGRLTVTGALMKIYEGPGLIVHKSRAKLLPINIQGAQLTPFSRLRGKVRILLFPQIIINIFPAQKLQINSEITGRKRRQKLSNEIYQLMTEMMFKSNDCQRTLFQSLIDARFVHGGRREIIEDISREPLTYKQLISRIFILGNLISKETNPEEYVGILLPNMISNVITFFALQAFSRVPAMLNYSTGIQNVILAVQTAQIKVIYTSKKFVALAKLNALITALQNENIKIIYLEEVREKLSFFTKLKGILMGQFPRLSYYLLHFSKSTQNLLDANQAAVILFTSGSEGTPKGVVLSHANIQANRYQLSSVIDFNNNDKVFNALPMFHSFGLTACTLLPILSGVSVFLYPSPLHYRVIPELSYDTNATILFGTDTFLSSYAKYAHPYDFYSLRYVFAGAEKLRTETYNLWLQKFGVRILEGYGATETSPVISINTPMKNKIGTVGCLLPGMRYQIKPVQDLQNGGQLCVLGPNVMRGYLLAKLPGVLVPIIPEAGYDTGDIVSIDDAGFISIQGRLKRFAKIAGEMVSLTMVEQYIQKLWPEYQHAVISMPNAKKGEEIVLMTTYSNATRENLILFAKENKLGEITVPKRIIFIEKMPLLSTGKIDYAALAK